eukprot:6284480-Lingulodinium_polyedra.AAC.1
MTQRHLVCIPSYASDGDAQTTDDVEESTASEESSDIETGERAAGGAAVRPKSQRGGRRSHRSGAKTN